MAYDNPTVTPNSSMVYLIAVDTAITALSGVTREGIVYAGGTTTNSLGQVFALRSGDVSSLRDFVIESQLLQDFDPGHLPVARDQAHVTIVDGAISPQPFMSVKVWADTPLAVQIDGKPYTIGPATPAATQVDATGTLTIISDATDLFATPLRIWAAFMDPFEHILIYPDGEFHGRMPARSSSTLGRRYAVPVHRRSKSYIPISNATRQARPGDEIRTL